MVIQKLGWFQDDPLEHEEIHVFLQNNPEFPVQNSFYIRCRESVANPSPGHILRIMSITYIETFFD